MPSPDYRTGLLIKPISEVNRVGVVEIAPLMNNYHRENNYDLVNDYDSDDIPELEESSDSFDDDILDSDIPDPLPLQRNNANNGYVRLGYSDIDDIQSDVYIIKKFSEINIDENKDNHYFIAPYKKKLPYIIEPNTKL